MPTMAQLPSSREVSRVGLLESALTGTFLNSLPEIPASLLKFTDAISCRSSEMEHYHSEVKGMGGRLVTVDKMKTNR